MTRKPLILVDLNDTIEAWRQKTNSLSQYVGAIDDFVIPSGDSAGGYSDIVKAVNSVSSKVDPAAIKQEISLNATNSSHSSLSYNSTTGVFTFVSNEIDGSFITDIDASRITTGTLNVNRIPNLDAGKITTGTIDVARLPASALQPSGEIYSTDSLDEGSLNLYYTDARARSSISSASPSFIGYNSSTGQISWTGPNLDGNELIAGTGVSISSSNQISIGQNVSTSSSVTFGSVTATGQISGGSIAGNMVATSAQATAGTATDVVMTPQRTQESVTKSWNDHVMLITYEIATGGLANNSFYDLLYDADADGVNDFGENQYPDFVELELVCRVAEHGWSIGDVIKVGATADPRAGNNGIAVKKNHLTAQPATGRSRQCMQIRIGEDGPGEYSSGTSGAGRVLTAANWYMRVRALKFMEYRASTSGTTTLYSFTDPGTGAIKSVSFTELGSTPTPASPSYTLTGPSSVNEGSTATFNITTTNVSDNTTLYWTLATGSTGRAPTLTDFSATSGTTVINGGTGSFTITAVADQTTEGSETYQVQLRTTGFTGTVVALQSAFTVNDTSTTFVQPPANNTGGGGDFECFVGEAQVLMSDLTTKPISEVVVGDFVLGNDGVTNEVIEVRVREVEGKFYAFNGVDYFVTPSHPFLTNEGWKSMDVSLAQTKYPELNVTQLEVGDELVMYNAETETYYEQQIFAINEETVEQTVFNLNVSGSDTPDKDGNDTYIVNGYVVHNK